MICASIEYVKKNRQTLVLSAIMTFVAHAIKFLNYYPTWDSPYGIIGSWTDMDVLGRWFAGTAENLLSSRYDLQWVEGVWAIIFISFVCSIMVNAFDIQNAIFRFLLISLFCVFPSFSATFMYGLWTPAYMFALFLACVAFYLCVKKKSRQTMVYAMVCITFSLAIYQIYFLFITALFLSYISILLFDGSNEWRHIVRLVFRIGIALIGGAIFYAAINKILQYVRHFELSDYQGMSKIGILSWQIIIQGAKNILTSLALFFLGDFRFSAFAVINVLTLVIIILLVCRRVCFNNACSIGRKILILLLYLLTIPVTYLFYFASEGVIYHKLMEIGIFVIYLFPLVLADREAQGENAIKRGVLVKSFIVMLFVTFLYHFVNNNVAYHQAQISYEKSYFSATEVLATIDARNPQELNEMIVLGGFRDGNQEIAAFPEITGASTNPFLQNENHFLLFAKYYLGREFFPCPIEKREGILSQINIDDHCYYPYGDYVEIVDDVIVVCLSRK